ncbi:MAG: hypothetical protein D8M52_07700 [Chlorobi bacterium]|nr:MAG: AAA family ATPase [Bacteroidota bacterium]MBE2264982.1 UvrD-helicase domain-containing protein [Flavobacteriales bacterium]MBL1161586.1 hypothetical protein [Chlorobiota bacterium]MBW7854169.1 UvrD-helicase domain-containing protein [Candidatus Kapabacteria bacterium]MCC6332242.1 UvrD-helicase domain-containing protein [Ignavibacteria bacterium]
MSLRLTPVPTPKPVADLLSGLNPQQAQAVSCTGGPLFIIAGAGSGKTRVLTVRIANLLASGVSAHSILALTFTNKAAKEMKERIETLVGSHGVHGMWVGTFHSMFSRILRRHADLIGHTNSFTIYDADDQLAAVKAVMAMLGISQQLVAPAAVRARISGAKNALISWQDFEREASTPNERQIAQIFQEYEKRLHQSNAMDFDDLLINTIQLFRSQPQVLEEYQDRFRYIMVDEYQDTNKAQYIVISMLARKYRNLCVVGDDAQSIYRWRGADINNILSFKRDYPEATEVRLEQNYRSTKTILTAADSVISRNSRQLKKSLWTENPDGEKIALFSCRDDREEAATIVSYIREQIFNKGTDYKDVAILYRTNAQSQALEDALRRENLPYLIVSGVSFYKRKEVKDTIAYLRLLVNPSDTESILRVINEPARGIGATSLQRLQEHASRYNKTLYQTMLDVGAVEGLQKRIQTQVADFVAMVERFRQHMNQEPPASLAQAYIHATGIMQMYKQQNTDEAEDRYNNIDRVLSHIAEQQDLDATLTLATYLEQVALVSEQDDPQLGSNRVSLMTMHAAKGLEFPLVIIAGLEQGLFPLQKAETDSAEMEEERRLFYVGITRAREMLVLTYAERRFRFGEIGFSRPSLFLSEIDAECLSMTGRVLAATPTSHAGTFTLGEAKQQHRSPYSQLPEKTSYSQIPRPNRYSGAVPPKPGSGPAGDANRYSVGQRVRHPLFGNGRIDSLSGTGSQSKAVVQFESGQRKHLMLSYAKLEIL